MDSEAYIEEIDWGIAGKFCKYTERQSVSGCDSKRINYHQQEDKRLAGKAGNVGKTHRVMEFPFRNTFGFWCR